MKCILILKMTTIDILPPEIISLIGTSLESFIDRQNVILAHPCFLPVNTEYEYHNWIIDQTLFISYYPTLRQKFDCLKKRKPKLQTLEIFILEKNESPIHQQNYVLNNCVQDIIYISHHVNLIFHINIKYENTLFGINNLFQVMDIVKSNKIEIILKISNIHLLDLLYDIFKTYQNVIISHLIINVDMSSATIDYRHSFTNILNHSFEHNVKLVEYPYSLGILPTIPPHNTQQIIVIDKCHENFISSTNNSLWNFFLQYPQSVNIKWKEIFTNCVMLINYLYEFKNIKNIGNEFQINSNITDYINVSHSESMSHFTSMLCDQNLTLVFENNIFDPNIIGFIKIIEKKFHEKNKHCTFKINVGNKIDLCISYLIFIRLLMTNPSIQLKIFYKSHSYHLEQTKIMNTPNDQLYQLYRSYHLCLKNHPSDFLLWQI